MTEPLFKCDVRFIYPVGHDIERIGKFLDLVATVDVESMVKTFSTYCFGALFENIQWTVDQPF